MLNENANEKPATPKTVSTLAKELGRDLIAETGSIEAAYAALCVTTIQQGLSLHDLGYGVSRGYLRMMPQKE
jgi:hypothetical protein